MDDLAVSLALAFGPDIPVKEEPGDSEDPTKDSVLDGNNMKPENPPAPGTKPKRVLSRRDALLNIALRPQTGQNMQVISVISIPCRI